MANDVKVAYVHGAAVHKAVDPTGNNYAANFARGWAVYNDDDVKAQRVAGIERDKAAFKKHLLSKK